MTGADRMLAASVLLLASAAPIVRPVWRQLDPHPANVLLAYEALRRREAVDPWGSPWVRTFHVRDALTTRSMGPDGWFGSADDVVFVPRDCRSLVEEATVYRSSPAIPIAVALILLLMRGLSCATRPGASLRERALAACALAILPTTLALFALARCDLWSLALESRPFPRLLSPRLGAVGSIYLFFAAATFVLRQSRAPCRSAPEARVDGAAD